MEPNIAVVNLNENKRKGLAEQVKVIDRWPKIFKVACHNAMTFLPRWTRWRKARRSPHYDEQCRHRQHSRARRHHASEHRKIMKINMEECSWEFRPRRQSLNSASRRGRSSAPLSRATGICASWSLLGNEGGAPCGNAGDPAMAQPMSSYIESISYFMARQRRSLRIWKENADHCFKR